MDRKVVESLIRLSATVEEADEVLSGMFPTVEEKYAFLKGMFDFQVIDEFHTPGIDTDYKAALSAIVEEKWR